MQHLKSKLILSGLKRIINKNRDLKKSNKKTLKSPIETLQLIK